MREHEEGSVPVCQRCIILEISTYRCRTISFSLVNHIEAFGVNGRDNVGPLVLFVGISVMSMISTGPWAYGVYSPCEVLRFESVLAGKCPDL